jgi:hypothetical protein
MTRQLLRGRGLVVIVGALMSASLALVAVPASATTHSSASTSSPAVVSRPVVVPLSAEGCAGDTCMYLSNPSGGYVSIKGWPYNVGFYGYFRLTGPGGFKEDSPTASYPAGGAGYTFTDVPATVGQWCVTGFSGTINEGEPCESIE